MSTKTLFIKVLNTFRINNLFLKFFKSPRIFLYHGVVSAEKNDGIGNYRNKHILLENFEKQIEVLRLNFKIVSIGELTRVVKSDPKSARGMVAITFDDGYRNVFKNAWPVLKKHRLPFSIFLPTDFIEKREPLWVDRLEYAIDKSKANIIDTNITKNGERISYDVSTKDNKIYADTQIREYAKSLPNNEREALINDIVKQSGIELRESIDSDEIYAPLDWQDVKEMLDSGLLTAGSHTKSHAIVSRISKDEFQEEISESKRIIEKNLNVSCEWFAYPNGKNKDFSADLFDILEQSGFKGALTTEMGFVGENFDFFAIPRIALDETNDMTMFMFTISGTRIFLRKFRNLADRAFSSFFSAEKPWSEEASITYFHDTAREYELAYESSTPRGYSFRIRRKRIMEAINYLPAGSKVLDIGCGPAVYTLELLNRGLEVWGVDPAEDMISIAKERFRNSDKAHFSVGIVEKMPFQNNFFDAIIAAGLFEYLDDKKSAMDEIKRVLIPGGMLISTFPYFWSAPRVWDRVVISFLTKIIGILKKRKPKMNSMEFKIEDAIKLTEACGFEVKHVNFYNTRLLWTPLDRFFPGISVKLSEIAEDMSPSWLKSGFIIYATRKR